MAEPEPAQALGWIGTQGRLRRAATGVVLLGLWIGVLLFAPAFLSALPAALLSAALVGAATLSLLQARAAT